jgi:hypothetical protein
LARDLTGALYFKHSKKKCQKNLKKYIHIGNDICFKYA